MKSMQNTKFNLYENEEVKVQLVEYSKTTQKMCMAFIQFGRERLVSHRESSNQSLKKRLLQHYSRCHNEKLKAWINSSHQLWFGVEPVTNMGSIDAKERNRIKKYAPLTNELLRKRENQYGTNTSSI